MVLDPASRALATNRWRLTVAVGDGNALEPRRAMAARKQRSSGKPMKDSAPDESFLVVSSTRRMTSLLVLGRMRSRGLDASIGAGGPFVVRPRKHTLAEQMFLVASEDARVLADNNGCRPSGPPGPDPRGQATGARPMHRSVGKVAFIRFQPACRTAWHPGPATRVPRYKYAL